MTVNAINSVAAARAQNLPAAKIERKEDGNWFTNWLNDKDKVCTDNKDDGKISFGEKMASFGKGLMCLVKGIIKHPITTGLMIAGGIALTAVTGGAALPILVAAGVAIGGIQIGHGIYKAATAKTDAQAKAAWEEMGSGTFAVAASALGAKSALKMASNSGVTAADGAEELNMFQATAKCFSPKLLAESDKMSGLNAKGNFSVCTAPKVEYMSKANDVQAYRFNPNGSEAEILQNNPGVFVKDGKYYVNNKWNPSEPFAINPGKEQMIMMYGEGDMAVCDGAVFKGSYVDTQGFKDGALSCYQDPATLKFGKVVNITKQAPGAYKTVPVGTRVKTLEGWRTVGEGEVVALDHAGNPYVTTMSNVLKRNIPLETDASKAGFTKLGQSQQAFERAQASVKEYGFALKDGQQATYEAGLAEVEKDSFFGKLGPQAVKDLISKMDALTRSNSLTTKTYLQACNELDIPGSLARYAMSLYARCGEYANVKQLQSILNSVVKGHKSYCTVK